MADTVTLKSYLAELNILFENESFTEVISHCRHILQHYPQNVETYRLLAKSLLQRGVHEASKNQFDEAAEIFSRVLTVYPNDYVAHLGLSEISEYNNDINLAIWHMERAYEQMPGNTVLQDALRDLYAKRDGEQHTPQKIQLTRGALARQYSDGQLYDQALLELRTALEQAPDRVDLQVLQAETLWESQHYVEAGEVAIQILNKLPNCLPANRILAQLWLAYERPTDAQLFLDRVDALDPYEAMRLLHADEEHTDANELPRLDYNAQAAVALSTETPDWVQDLEGLGERGFDMSDALQTPDEISPPSPDRIDTEALFGSPSSGGDWFTDSDVTEEEDVPDWFADLTRVDARTVEENDSPEWLPTGDRAGEPQPSLQDLFGAVESGGGAAAPDWLSASEAGAEPQPSFGDLFGEEEPAEEAAAAPEWLGTSEPSAEAQPSFQDLFGEEEPVEEAAPDWLGAAETSAEPAALFEDLFGEEEPTEEAGTVEPAASFEDLFGEEEPVEEAAPDWLGAAEPRAELESSFEDLFGEEEPAEEAAVAPEWLGAAEPSAEPQTSFEDLFGEEEPAEEAAAAPDWLGAAEPRAELESSFEDLFGEEEPAEEAAAAPDWLSAAEPSAELESSFEDLSGEEEPVEEAAAAPNWLSASEPSAEPQASFEDLFGEEEPVEEAAVAPEWLGASEPSAEPQASFEDLLGEEEPVEEAAVAPNWLSAAEPSAEPQASFEDLFGKEEPAEEAAAAPEWLGAAEPSAELESSFEDLFDEEEPVEEAGAAGPSASFEDLFGEEEPVEEADFSEQDVNESDMAPSGFTDLLQNIEIERASASLLDETGMIEPTPPDWLAAFESDITTSTTPQEETVVESADEQFDWSAFEDTMPEPMMTESETGIELASAEPQDQISGDAPDWMIEPELDFFAPASDDIHAIAPAESPDIQPPVEDGSLGWLGPDAPEEDDWLGSFARAEPELVSPEPAPSAPDIDQIRDTNEWLAEMPDLELETVSEPSLDEPVSFDEVEDDLFGAEEITLDLGTEVPEPPDLDEGAAPAWMADLEPIEEAPSEPDVLAQAYEPFEAGSPDQVPGYRATGDTGVLQPDEQPDWMAAFTGEEMPDRVEEADLAAQEDELVLEDIFGGEEDTQSERQPITEGLSDITFDEIEVEEDLYEPDVLAPPAEDEGEMPDWLVAITSSEADKLDDMIFDEVDETYSISAADSGVLQPDEQPDWLVQVGAPETVVDEAAPEPDDFVEEDMFSGQPDAALAQPDDLAHTKEVAAEDEWTEVDAEDEEEVPADFVFEDVVPAWLRRPKESDLASPSHGEHEIASEMPEWLRDVMEDDDIGE